MRPRPVPLVVLVTLLAGLAAAPPALPHGEGRHVGFVSTVSTIDPPQPGLLVQVLGGHERLSVANLTQKDVVILDESGEPLVRIPAGTTEVWDEPRIGAGEDPPETPGLVRNWRIAGTADGEPFEIVGFLGYRPPAGAEAAASDDGLPLWALVLAAAAGLLAVAAAVALPLRLRRRGEGRGEAPTSP